MSGAPGRRRFHKLRRHHDTQGGADQFMPAVSAPKSARYGVANPRNITDIAAVCAL